MHINAPVRGRLRVLLWPLKTLDWEQGSVNAEVAGKKEKPGELEVEEEEKAILEVT